MPGKSIRKTLGAITVIFALASCDTKTGNPSPNTTANSGCAIVTIKDSATGNTLRQDEFDAQGRVVKSSHSDFAGKPNGYTLLTYGRDSITATEYTLGNTIDPGYLPTVLVLREGLPQAMYSGRRYSPDEGSTVAWDFNPRR